MVKRGEVVNLGGDYGSSSSCEAVAGVPVAGLRPGSAIRKVQEPSWGTAKVATWPCWHAAAQVGRAYLPEPFAPAVLGEGGLQCSRVRVGVS